MIKQSLGEEHNWPTLLSFSAVKLDPNFVECKRYEKQGSTMTELLEVIEKRRARRALSEKAIPEDAVVRLMTAASYAPSCYNNQPWRFMVITDENVLKVVHKTLTAGNYWAKRAPLIVIVATKPEFDAQLSDGRQYALLGCGLAIQNLLLQAASEGLYAHPMAGFDPLALKQAFGIPSDYIVICVIAVGYPGSSDLLNEKHKAAEQSDRVRKPESEVICRNSWLFN